MWSTNRRQRDFLPILRDADYGDARKPAILRASRPTGDKRDFIKSDKRICDRGLCTCFLYAVDRTCPFYSGFSQVKEGFRRQWQRACNCGYSHKRSGDLNLYHRLCVLCVGLRRRGGLTIRLKPAKEFSFDEKQTHDASVFLRERGERDVLQKKPYAGRSNMLRPAYYDFSFVAINFLLYYAIARYAQRHENFSPFSNL